MTSGGDGADALHGAHVRLARPTDDLDAVTRFYREAFGFETLGSFVDHEGFDGVMLGHHGAGHHLEFTHQRGARVGRAPTSEHLLVFYLPDESVWRDAVRRALDAGAPAVPATNPYWQHGAVTFEDPDGYRVVLRHGPWPPGGEPSARPVVLLIGLDASVVDFDKWPQLTRASLEASLADVEERLRADGCDAATCLTDLGETAVATVRAALVRRRPDVVVIGNGIRGDPELLPLFEEVLAEVTRTAPGARIAFNTLPHDTVEAVRRALARRT